MNEVNLLKVARALREAGNSPGFTMARFHDCGTPGCALGHYAFRTDLQQTFVLGTEVTLLGANGQRDETGCNCSLCRAADLGLSYNGSVVLDHFDITGDQAQELFSSRGCGEAQTPIEAAKYIEAFVARHREMKETGERVGRGEPLVGA